MRTAVLINSRSRQAKQHMALVKKFFDKHKDEFQLAEFIVIEKPGDFEASLEQLRKLKGITCIVVGSGDGTIVAALNALKGRRGLVYGFVPLGTSNTFVRSLGLPLGVKESLDVIDKKHVRMASLGSINGTLFANIADIGVPARVAENLTDRVKKYLGSLAYAVSGIRELVRHDAFWCEISINGKTESFYTHQVYVANGTYRGPVPYGDENLVYTETLTLGYSATMSRFEYMKHAFNFITNKPERARNFHRKQVTHATIKTKPVQAIQADGEIIGKTPVKIKVVKNAIKVFAQPERQDLPRKSSRNRR